MHSVLEPIPPVIPLLTMIRLSEDVVTEVQKRRCPPGEQFIFGIIIQMWPVFREAMSQNIEALKKLAEGTSGGYFARATVTTDAMVSDVSIRFLFWLPMYNLTFRQVCRKYVVCFNAFVYLTADDEETMIFSKYPLHLYL